MGNELINKNFDDCYFSIESGYKESEHVFIKGNNIENRLQCTIKIGETGFGTGLNLLVLEDVITKSQTKDLEVVFTTVEKYPLNLEEVRNAILMLKEVSSESLERHIVLYKNLFMEIKNGWNVYSVKREWGNLKINLYIGDILDSFKDYPTINNIWFLDGHSPDKNPDMWSEKVFKQVAKQSDKGATFATFTAAGVVKRGLREAGFNVKRAKGFGKKRHMINGIL